jgi:hypothetical protein
MTQQETYDLVRDILRSTQIQLAYKTAASWSPTKVLLPGQVGIESDTRLMKIGNGSTAWSSLPYIKINAADVIDTSARRFVTDAQITAWNSITSGITLSTTLTGYSDTTGAVSSSDTILTAFGKINQKLNSSALFTSTLTGYADVSGTVSASDTILTGLGKINQKLNSSSLFTSALTGYADVSGTVSASDTILTGFGKINQKLNSSGGSVTGTISFAGNQLSNPKLLGYTESTTAPAISSGVLNIDCTTSNVFSISHNQDITSITLSNLPTGTNCWSGTIIFKQDATGSRTITFPASFKFGAAGTPTVVGTANTSNIISIFTFDAGTTFFATFTGGGF